MEQTEEKARQALNLFQKKYRILEEIYSITSQMEEVLFHKDQVSFQMLLKMRAEEMAAADRIQEELWLLGENSPETGIWMRRLMSSEFLEKEQEDPTEERIRRLRLGTQKLIGRLQQEDRKLNIRTAGKKSWYERGGKGTAGGTEK